MRCFFAEAQPFGVHVSARAWESAVPQYISVLAPGPRVAVSRITRRRTAIDRANPGKKQLNEPRANMADPNPL